MKNNTSNHRPALLALTLATLGTCALLAQNPETRPASNEIENTDPFRKEHAAQSEAIKGPDHVKAEPEEKEDIASDGSSKTAPTPTKHDTKIYTDSSDLPQSEELVVTFMIQPKSISTNEAERILRSVASQGPGNCSVVAAPSSNTVVIVGQVPMIRKLDTLLRILDNTSLRIPRDIEQATESYDLKYIDPTELATILNQLVAPEHTVNLNKSDDSAPSASEGTQPRIVVVPRSKQILIKADRMDVLYLMSVIQKLDNPKNQKPASEKELGQ